MHRYEYKYLIPFDQADFVRDAVAPFTTPDSNNVDRQRHYTIRSIYLDRPRFRNYLEKKEGLKNRRKLRIRGYNQGGLHSEVFLEIKRRTGVPILKARAAVTLRDVPELLASGDISRFVASPGTGDYRDARSFLYYYHRFALRPTIKIIYEREAYIGRFDPSVRVTLDHNLRSELFPRVEDLFREDNLRYVYHAHFILEIKFTGTLMPVWARTLVERIEGKWRALSKYTLSLDSHRLPMHRLNAAVREAGDSRLNTIVSDTFVTNPRR